MVRHALARERGHDCIDLFLKTDVVRVHRNDVFPACARGGRRSLNVVESLSDLLLQCIREFPRIVPTALRRRFNTVADLDHLGIVVEAELAVSATWSKKFGFAHARYDARIDGGHGPEQPSNPAYHRYANFGEAEARV